MWLFFTGIRMSLSRRHLIAIAGCVVALGLFLRPSSPWKTRWDGTEIMSFEPLQLPFVGSLRDSPRHMYVNAFHAIDEQGERTPTLIFVGTDWIQVGDELVDDLDALEDRIRSWPIRGPATGADSRRDEFGRGFRNVLLAVDSRVTAARLQQVLRTVRVLEGADVHLWGSHTRPTRENEAPSVPWRTCLPSLKTPDGLEPFHPEQPSPIQEKCGNGISRVRQRNAMRQEADQTLPPPDTTRHHISRTEHVPVVPLEGSWHEDQCLEDLRLEQMAAVAR